MRDWNALVRNRLPAKGLAPAQSAEIIAELAGHLEEFHEEQRAQGATDAEALALTLAQIENWRDLAHQIKRAKRKDGYMNQRTKSLWLPGLLNITAACALMAILAQTSYRIQIVMSHPRLVDVVIYPAWLAVQPLLGATGAYASRRAGGSRLARLAAGLFPSIILVASLAGVFLVRAIAVALRGGNGQIGIDHIDFWRSTLGVIVIPGLALLLGILPFLRSRTPPVLAQN